MEYVYAIVNFLILAAIILIFGLKPLRKKFSARREKINADLDRAEAPVPEPEQAEEPAAAEKPEADADPALAELREETARRKEYLREQSEARIAAARREAMILSREKAVKSLCGMLRVTLAEEPRATLLRKNEEKIVDRIVERATLTPGDMCYLMHHDVLYVTLSSAYPLPDDLVEKCRRRADELLDEVGGKASFWVRVDPDLVGGLRLRIGDTVYDYTVENRLYHLERDLMKRPLGEDPDADAVLKEVMDGIAEAEPRIDEFQLGRVLSVSDGICRMDGLADIMYGEVVEFECGERGMVLDIEPGNIGCVVFGRFEQIETLSSVRRVGRIASVPVGEELLGRVVDPLGRAIDGGDRIRARERRPIEFRSAPIPDRRSVSVPMHTGIKAIDALVPVGRGQRELIIGDRSTGKSALAVDAIINQKGKDVPCIYVAIGQKDSTVADIRAKLTKYGAMEYTTIVSAPASSSASMQYIAPFAGAAMSEYFMYRGKDCLIVYDDLSKHAVAYRELSLLLHRPSG
ncbi:MAG: F0F1 ATP synthase subunit delta, partial [Clostridia bacterium]|nr:F0F1 ATP synthase subunit delta [Clostridia bacterium]